MSRKPKQIELTDAELVSFLHDPFRSGLISNTGRITTLNHNGRYLCTTMRGSIIKRGSFDISMETSPMQICLRCDDLKVSDRFHFAAIWNDVNFLDMTPYQSVTKIGQMVTCNPDYRFNPKHSSLRGYNLSLYVIDEFGTFYALDEVNRLNGYRIEFRELAPLYMFECSWLVGLAFLHMARLLKTKQIKPLSPSTTRRILKELFFRLMELSRQADRRGISPMLIREYVKWITERVIHTPRDQRHDLWVDVFSVFSRSTRILRKDHGSRLDPIRVNGLKIVPITTPRAYRTFYRQMRAKNICLDIHALEHPNVHPTYAVYKRGKLLYTVIWDRDHAHGYYDVNNEMIEEIPYDMLDVCGCHIYGSHIHPHAVALRSHYKYGASREMVIRNIKRLMQTGRPVI